MTTVLKTVDCNRCVGSRPTASAKHQKDIDMTYDVSAELAKKEREFILIGLERVRKNFLEGMEFRLEEAKRRRAELLSRGISAV